MVQKLESLRLGDRPEPRLLRWDLTFSPPQKSLPDEETGDELKSRMVSAARLCKTEAVGPRATSWSLCFVCMSCPGIGVQLVWASTGSRDMMS